MLIILVIILLGLGLGACAYFNQPKFGQHPQGERLAEVEASPNYVEGAFQNQLETPMFSEGNTFLSVLLHNFFSSKERPIPAGPVPALKTDLKALDPQRNVLVWFGHSSFYMQLGGKRYLVDPVFSPYAAPFSWANKAFAGTVIYSAADMPDIDYLIITHDHWDHLDYPSVVELEPRVGKAVCPLGVGAHLEPWGYAREKLLEADWYDVLEPEEGVSLHALPARHFSGRLLTRNKTLWAGFAVEGGGKRILFGGDSGYGPHYAEAGECFGGFDLVILENGQYDERWPYIHMMPEETAQAAQDLKSLALLPAHSGKFCISNHAWDDPLKRILEASRERPYRLLTPLIGQVVDLDDQEQTFPLWWAEME